MSLNRNRNRENRKNFIWVEDKTFKKDVCFECGKGNCDIDYHHVVPYVSGGRQTVPLCLECHGKVHGLDKVKHKELQKIGIESAKKRGVYRGRRPNASETPEKFLSKEKNVEIINKIIAGQTYDQISKEVGCSKTTITKVTKMYCRYHGHLGGLRDINTRKSGMLNIQLLPIIDFSKDAGDKPISKYII